eukprot:TRINITY_DN110858_c0_g1_i1.p1 TRINITY_DN110858_c0_g1~~TRINITY_DN110858_c0_g1_i1.p1  ORF type:complete len:802 (+),score=202.96 TRINITY_DN110858_c0_g1_i1:99-2408(+)
MAFSSAAAETSSKSDDLRPFGGSSLEQQATRLLKEQRLELQGLFADWLARLAVAQNTHASQQNRFLEHALSAKIGQGHGEADGVRRVSSQGGAKVVSPNGRCSKMLLSSTSQDSTTFMTSVMPQPEEPRTLPCTSLDKHIGGGGASCYESLADEAEVLGAPSPHYGVSSSRPQAMEEVLRQKEDELQIVDVHEPAVAAVGQENQQLASTIEPTSPLWQYSGEESSEHHLPGSMNTTTAGTPSPPPSPSRRASANKPKQPPPGDPPYEAASSLNKSTQETMIVQQPFLQRNGSRPSKASATSGGTSPRCNKSSKLSRNATSNIEAQAAKLRRKTGVDGKLANAEAERPADDLPGLLGKYQRWARLCIKSHPFTFVCSSAIFLNSVLIGYNAEAELRTRLERQPFEESKLPEHTFFVYFSLELLLRLYAAPVSFFIGEDFGWNLFDALLVLNSTVEYALSGASFPSLMIMRVLRVCRMFRILRVVRVMRFFRTLRLMLTSIVSSVVPLFWVFVLLFFALYIWAIVFVRATLDYYVELEMVQGQAVQDATLEQLVFLFGSVLRALVTLFMTVSGGKDWSHCFEPLLQLGAWYALLYFFYIFFVLFGILNVVTSTFVDILTMVSKRDVENVIEEHMLQAAAHAESVRVLFEAADKDGSGTVTLKELEEQMLHEKMKAYLSSLDIDALQATSLFTLLDKDNSGELGMEEFVQGCARLKGAARSIDVNMLLVRIEQFVDNFSVFKTHTEETLASVVKEIGGVDNVKVRECRQRSV